MDYARLLCRHTRNTLADTPVDTLVQRENSHTSDSTWEIGKSVLLSHAVPKDEVLAEQAGRRRDRSNCHCCTRRHTAELDSSSVDAPWTLDAARVPEYAAEVAVMVGSAADFDLDFVIVAVVIAALLVVAFDPGLAVQTAVAVGGFLPVDSVASQSDAVQNDVEYNVAAHYVRSGCYGRFASFRDRHLEGSCLAFHGREELHRKCKLRTVRGEFQLHSYTAAFHVA